MYEFSKVILGKVSFDKILFRKELAKAIKWIKPQEKKSFMRWCLYAYGNKYKDIIRDVFRNIRK